MAAFIAAAKAAKKAKEGQDSTGSVQNTITIQSNMSTQKLDCPFNLDEIFQADIDRFGSLKDVIKFIIDNLEKTNTKITEVDVKMAQKFMDIAKIKSMCNDNKAEIEGIRKIINELEQKSVEADENISEIKTQLEPTLMNVTLCNRKLKDHTATIKEIQEIIAKLGNSQGQSLPPIELPKGGDVDINQLGNIFVSKDAFSSLVQRVTIAEENIVRQKDNHNSLSNSVNQQLEDLENKFRNYYTKPEIDSMMSSMNTAPIDIKPSSDGNIDLSQFTMQLNQIQSELRMKANQSDLSELSSQIAQVSRKANADKQATNKEIDRIDAMIEQLRQSLGDIQDKQSTLGRELDRLNQFIEMLSKQMNNLRNQSTPQQQAPTGGIDEATLREILDRLAALENELMNMKNEFSRWYKDIQDSLNQKADIDTVKALEQSLMERLNEMCKALSKQFADKNDTRKALKLLEKNLKNMYDLFMSKGGQDNEDDAMFTKKPLGGTSCASCAKDVIDLYGKRVDYLPWGKLPFRDPSERIARVGQGFSKMLSMINPEQLSRYDGAQGYNHAGSQEGLPTGQYIDPMMQAQDPQARNMSRGNMGLPPNGKTAQNFNPNYKQGMDMNRPGSAQVKPHRPITRGGSKNRKPYQ